MITVEGNKNVLNKLEEAYGNIDLPLKEKYDKAFLFDSIGEFKSKFFNRVAKTGLDKAYFPILGNNKIKWAEQAVLQGKILVLECNTRNTNKFTVWGVI